MSLLIIKPGVQSTIQARSRNGMRHLGIPSGGAADPLSLALANRLVGNQWDAPAIEAALVIELDGPQHLADPAAYRRDRRKDALLQEHGYIVLRFLVQDVGKRLDEVLDAILRVLAMRERTP